MSFGAGGQAPRVGALLLFALLLIVLGAGPALAQPPTFLEFESGHARPLALSPDGTKLFAVNTPDNHLEIFDVLGDGTLSQSGSVQVGMEPVAVAARTNTEVWVVNHLSDSVSVVDLSGAAPRVARTLLVGDEPGDIVFAGPGGDRAFITTAHRGQNSPFPRSQYNSEGVGRADIWVFDATDLDQGGSPQLGGVAETLITVFGDKPRALAVSANGSTVYAAIFHSGNRTTALHEGLLLDTSASNMNSGAVQPAGNTGTGEPSEGGLPPPHQNAADADRPEVGLIVKENRDGASPGEWQDELGRDWSAVVRFDLPDRDVFAINANANPPVALGGDGGCSIGTECWNGVGTVLFNMAVNPVSGKIYVSNTDSQNHVRFEGPGVHAGGIKPGGEPDTVQGNLSQARITVLDGVNIDARHLNKHLDYSILPAPVADKAKSLATPMGMAVTPDGATLYVAAFGSNRIGVFDTSELENDSFVPDAADHILLGGDGGPSGLVLDGNRLYVMTRFDNSVNVIDTTSETEIQSLSLHNPEPPSIVNGRPFLYDSQLTSSNGEASCSSCHIFGDMDDLAWDLGNPDDVVVANGNPFNPVVPPIGDPLPHNFHPMKGPMTTQSLRGLDNMGPQHWRGDRQGSENAAFNAFNVAFPGLVGRASQFSASDMQKFTNFALQLRYPPNPIRKLDNDLRADEQAGSNLFSGAITDVVANCDGCHTIDGSQGFFGTDGQTVFDGTTQHIKVPHLRNQYQKIGMFGLADAEAPDLPVIPGGSAFTGSFAHTGNQVRGFGFLHDGSVDTDKRFVGTPLFDMNNTEENEMEAFLMAFDTDLAPIVGQQVTLTSANETAADPRIDLLIQRADAAFTSLILNGSVTECDLIAKVVEGGVEGGYRYTGGGVGSGLFQPDDGGPSVSDATLRSKANTAGQEVTYTCTPPGSGTRMAIDRDEDTLTDGVETDTGVFVNASDTGTSPALADTDGDGFDDGVEVAAGTDPIDPASFPGAPQGNPASVPALSSAALGVLASLLALGGAWLGRRRRSRG